MSKAPIFVALYLATFCHLPAYAHLNAFELDPGIRRQEGGKGKNKFIAAEFDLARSQGRDFFVSFKMNVVRISHYSPIELSLVGADGQRVGFRVTRDANAFFLGKERGEKTGRFRGGQSCTVAFSYSAAEKSFRCKLTAADRVLLDSILDVPKGFSLETFAVKANLPSAVVWYDPLDRNIYICSGFANYTSVVTIDDLFYTFGK